MSNKIGNFKVSREAVVVIRTCRLIAHQPRFETMVKLASEKTEESILDYLFKPETFFTFDDLRFENACEIIKYDSYNSDNLRVEYEILDETSPLGFEK